MFVQGGTWKTGETATFPAVTIAMEQWDRMARLLQQKKDVELELNVANTFYDNDPMQYNTIAEIPGTDKKDEIVMVGAHLDSWHSGTGATDNGAGTVVMMEAMRILKAVDAKPRRTVRIGLWTGEEQGLLGSQFYVQQHFGSRPAMNDPEMKDMPTLLRRQAGPVTVKPEQAKVSAYLNVDNGSGKMRGVYLQENEAVAPIFEAWMQPFKDLGMYDAGDAQHGWHRSPIVRRRWHSGVPVHPGPARLRDPHTPLEHGCVRPAAARRSEADGSDRGSICYTRPCVTKNFRANQSRNHSQMSRKRSRNRGGK